MLELDAGKSILYTLQPLQLVYYIVSCATHKLEQKMFCNGMQVV